MFAFRTYYLSHQRIVGVGGKRHVLHPPFKLLLDILEVLHADERLVVFLDVVFLQLNVVPERLLGDVVLPFGLLEYEGTHVVDVPQYPSHPRLKEAVPIHGLPPLLVYDTRYPRDAVSLRIELEYFLHNLGLALLNS